MVNTQLIHTQKPTLRTTEDGAHQPLQKCKLKDKF